MGWGIVQGVACSAFSSGARQQVPLAPLRPLSLPPHVPFLPQLPWKSLTSIIEYYYMWKTTDRYVQQVRPAHHCPAPPAGEEPGDGQADSPGWAAGSEHVLGQLLTRFPQGGHAWETVVVPSPLVPGLWPGLPADLSDPLFCFKKRLKAAEAESKLKQVYIPN